METDKIFAKLLETAERSPGSLSELSSKDLSDCLITELNCYGELYPAARRERLESTILAACASFDEARLSGDFVRIRQLLSTLYGISSGLPAPDDFDLFVRKAAFDSAALRHWRENTAVVLGDSHVNFFSGNEYLEYSLIDDDIRLCPQVNSLPFTAVYLGPCLAYSCMKEDSATDFPGKFKKLESSFLRPGARLILSLGEVDIRVHVLLQAEAQNKTVETVLDEILANYSALIGKLREKGYEIYCWGPIASQKDDSPVNPDFPRYGSERARNRATFLFNEKLRDLCKETGAVYMSIFGKMVSEDFLTREEFLSPDHFHLGQKAMEAALPVFREAGLIA
ncbi:MAG: SGNH/GDSL hydrolase family protein [Lachnospiraceae bacterium]|nr:SGNH/GDSL hydrolase family protein [Lachnospiraceae bacterium]